MTSKNTINLYELSLVENEYDNAGLDPDKEEENEEIHDDDVPASTIFKPSIQSMGIKESVKKTGKLTC